jgi:hypothetical protein
MADATAPAADVAAAAARPWVKAPVVMLEWEELTAPVTSPALLAKLEAAYGYDGLGILAVRGIPGYVPARAAALPQAHAFGSLPDAVKAQYVDEASTFSFGWSHGKERLEGGRLDTAKGSYYNNPVHDAPFAHDAAAVAAHPSFASPNIWPSEADAPGFTASYKTLARLIVDAGGQLARHVDAYVASVEPAYPPGAGLALADVVTHCRAHKARLLYYFPTDGVETGDGTDVSSWCGCVVMLVVTAGGAAVAIERGRGGRNTACGSLVGAQSTSASRRSPPSSTPFSAAHSRPTPQLPQRPRLADGPHCGHVL